MLQIDDDMNDGLFRRAAEGYPLKTDNPDWDAVLARMKGGNIPPGVDSVASGKEHKKKRRWLLLLLLLLPLSIFIYRNKTMDHGSKPLNTVVQEAENVNTTSNEDKRAQLAAADIATLDPIQKQQVPVNGTTTDFSSTIQQNIVPGKPLSSAATITAGQQKNGNNFTGSGNKRSKSTLQKSKASIQASVAEADEEIIVKYPVSKKTGAKQQVHTTSATATETAVDEAPAVTKTKINSGDIAAAKEPGIDTNLQRAATEKTAEEKEEEKKNALVNTIEKEKQKKKPEEKPVDKKEENKKTRYKRFYAGLVAAPDVSAIKFQSVKRIGFNYGFLLGYRVTKKLSVEAGLLQDRKYYSTDGKYFSTKDIYMPAYSKIEYVDGVCRMLELPVNITYTFSTKTKSSWFAAAGVSSYFMQHESYMYDVSYGSGYRHQKPYDYDNKSTSLLALLNISAGYTYKIGKIGNLRVEPYIKLPLSKVGTGKLPIQSGGVFIGLTKDIF